MVESKPLDASTFLALAQVILVVFIALRRRTFHISLVTVSRFSGFGGMLKGSWELSFIKFRTPPMAIGWSALILKRDDSYGKLSVTDFLRMNN